MAFTKELLDEILKDNHGPDDFYGPTGIMKQPARAPVERTMEAELAGRSWLREAWPGRKNVRQPPERENGERTEYRRRADGH
jgi:hypothetical protein